MNGLAAPRRSTVGCVIPAGAEPGSIAQVIESLLLQSRVPDVIHVVATEASDETVAAAARYAGPHARVTELGPQFTVVFVHDIAGRTARQAGALNYGYSLVEGYDYLLGVGGDTVAEMRAVEYLEAEATSDARIGGVAAFAGAADGPGDPWHGRSRMHERRPQSAAERRVRLRGRGAMAAGGRFSIFSTQALRDVMEQYHRSAPWTAGGIEDSQLTLQMNRAGYFTRTSPFVRAATTHRPHAFGHAGGAAV